MISTSLINLAVLTYQAFSSGHRVDFDTHNGLDIYVVRDSALHSSGDWSQPPYASYWPAPPCACCLPAPGPLLSARLMVWSNRNVYVSAKVVTRADEMFVSGYCGHLVQNLPRPSQDPVVLRENSLSEKLGLETVTRPDKEIVALQVSASDLPSALTWGEQIKKETPQKPPLATQWENKFVLIWDEDDGFYFHGKYYPMSVDPLSSVGLPSCGEPVKCVILSPTDRGVDDAHHVALKASFGGGTPTVHP